ELWRDFLSWAEAGGAQGLDQVRIAFVAKDDGPVRGLVATREVTSPIILPRCLLLTASSESELGIKLALEKKRMLSGLGSFWTPWIRILPDKAELQQYHIAYASEELLDAFHELPVVARTRAWHQSLAENWRQEAEKWQQQAEEIGLTALTFDDFFWACTVVKTRVYLPPPMYCFMPLADMMNTEPEPNMDVYDSLEVDAPGRTEYYGILLRDGCRVSAGQELTQAYRPVDNSERLFRGGFLLKDNPVAVPRLAISVPASEVSPGSPLELSLRRLVAEHATAPEQVGETEERCDADGGSKT
ncbi:SETD3, partial [Symbiodinium sp. CCMP2456]